MLITLLVTLIAAMVCVLLHYEALLRLTFISEAMRIRPRKRIVFSIVGALIAHVMEVWVFTFCFYGLLNTGAYGKLMGNFSDSLSDCAYFSFSTYTSLGFGDITPTGPLRFLAGMEALTGLVLIAWTASYMFVQMQRHWDKR